MIILGDLQADEKQPHRQAVLNLFDWFYENYPDEIYIQVGDFFDSSACPNDVRDEVLEKILRFKEFHALTGNHDKSSKSKNILLPFRHHKNIFIYDNKDEVTIDGYKCLMLPFQRSVAKVEEYQVNDNEFDFVFSHFFHPKKSFKGIEAIDLSSIKSKWYIYGHDHTYAVIDKVHIVTGCIIPASQGQINNSAIQTLRLPNGDIELVPIEHPIYFEYEEVEYGEQPKSKNNILNIKNAPSVDSVYDLYKDCYIRTEGITFKQSDDINLNDISFDMSDLSGQFITFSEQPDMSIAEDVKKTCLKYLKI